MFDMFGKERQNWRCRNPNSVMMNLSYQDNKPDMAVHLIILLPFITNRPSPIIDLIDLAEKKQHINA
jgi:hypothetical protein